MTETQIQKALLQASLSDLARAMAQKRQIEKPDSQRGGRKPQCGNCRKPNCKSCKRRGLV